MPSEPYLWLILILAVALVAGLAIWKGGQFKMRASKKEGVSIEAGGKADTPGGRISVLDRGNISDSDIDRIAGQVDEQVPAGGIEVMNKGKIRGAKIGSIVGSEMKGKRDDDA